MIPDDPDAPTIRKRLEYGENHDVDGTVSSLKQERIDWWHDAYAALDRYEKGRRLHREEQVRSAERLEAALDLVKQAQPLAMKVWEHGRAAAKAGWEGNLSEEFYEDEEAFKDAYTLALLLLGKDE